MTRQDNKLTALKVKALEKPGRYGDGLGLWLQVSEKGGKSWVFRYMLHGKTVHMGLGATQRKAELDALGQEAFATSH
jgi:Arm domain-containing DNA-binding protein